jgi:AraC-like DNA-binding protein
MRGNKCRDARTACNRNFVRTVILFYRPASTLAIPATAFAFSAATMSFLPLILKWTFYNTFAGACPHIQGFILQNFTISRPKPSPRAGTVPTTFQGRLKRGEAVNDIVKAMGFTSANQFYRIYKRHFGHTIRHAADKTAS